jgi:hypothetical protein
MPTIGREPCASVCSSRHTPPCVVTGAQIVGKPTVHPRATHLRDALHPSQARPEPFPSSARWEQIHLPVLPPERLTDVPRLRILHNVSVDACAQAGRAAGAADRPRRVPVRGWLVRPRGADGSRLRSRGIWSPEPVGSPGQAPAYSDAIAMADSCSA